MSLRPVAALVSSGLSLLALGCGAAAGPVTDHEDDAVVTASGESAPGCVPTAGCSAGKYCATGPGECTATGSCQDSPRVCPELIRLVCGCDGTTYDNACFAQRAGVSVDHEGGCPSGG